jgi:hypothetical protein
MERDKLISKLKGLLSRTTANGASEAEMKTALAMASKLMAEHSIDVAEVEARAGTAAEFHAVVVREDIAGLGDALLAALPVVEEVTGAKALVVNLVGDSFGQRLVLFGDLIQCESGVWLAGYVETQYRDLLVGFCTRKGAKIDAIGAGFYGGLTRGVLDRLRFEGRARMLKLGRERSTALARRVEQRDEAFKATFPESRAIARTTTNDSAFADGYADAKHVNVARRLDTADRKAITA